MVAPKAASAFTMDCRMPIYDLQLENPDSETTSQSISKLHDVYSRKLSDVETCSANQVDLLENRQKILQSYVDDLRKLNSFLVETLQEFEKESRNHVELLESRLIKTASSAKDYVCKVCDLEHDLLTAINDKKQAVESEQVFCDQLKNLDCENNSLQDRNANLRHDIQSLIKIIQSFRHTGSWQIDNVTFCEVTFDEVYGSPRYSSPCSSRGSYSNIVGQRQDTLSKSFTLNLNKCSFDDTSDTSASFYKDCTPWFNEYNPAPINPEENFFQIIRLKSELRSLLMQNENLQSQLCERNCVIAELESKVTELNHEVLVKAAEVEYCRSISDIHCDSKQSSQKSRENSYCDVTLKTDLSVDYLTAMDDQDEELQMQENRDSNMSLPKFVVDNDEISSQSRIHLESFCDANLNQIYDDRLELNSQLDDALEKIKYLEAQISKLKSSSHESLNALTAEIVERHDIIHRLKQEKQLEKDKHKETSIRLQFFGEIIKDLRKKNHDDRFRYDNRQRTDVLCQNCLSTIEKASVVTDCDAKEESLTTTGGDLSRYSSDEAELRDGDSESSAVSKVERDQWHLKCRYGACFNDNSNDDANTRSEMSCKCENITSSTMDSYGHFGSPVLEEICSQELPPWPASTEDVSVQTVSFDEHDVMISAKIFNDRGAQTNNKLFSELCGSSVAINQEQPDVLQESFAKDDKAPQLLLKIHSLQEDLTKAKDEGQSKNMLIAQLQMHLKTVVNELELKDVTLHNIETKLDNVRQDNELFRSKLASITDQMEIFQNKVDVGQEQNANLQIQLDAKVKEIEELIEAENTMLEQKRSLMIQLDTRGSELLATTDDNTLLITKLEEKTLEIENLKLTVQNFQKAVIHEKKMSDDMKKLMKQKVSSGSNDTIDTNMHVNGIDKSIHDI